METMTTSQDRFAFTKMLGFLMIVVLICHVQDVSSFSDGSKLAQGFSATRSVFCHRSTNKRQPLHFNSKCNGYCEPNRHGELYYDLGVSASTYWLDLISVNITAKEDSDRSVTGFSIYAVDESQMVAGSFVEDENNILVGSCGDILAYNQETHGAFHKMADHDRKNITLKFQPDGFNHGEIRFIIWIVNNHSDIHYIESQPLTPSKNGTNGLDLENVLNDIVSDVDIQAFEKSFEYRKKLGYRLDLDNPFSPFDGTPDSVALVPLNLTTSFNNVQKESVSIGNYSGVETAAVEVLDTYNGSDSGPDVPVSDVVQDKPFAEQGASDGYDYFKLFSESFDPSNGSEDGSNYINDIGNLLFDNNNHVADNGNQVNDNTKSSSVESTTQAGPSSEYTTGAPENANSVGGEYGSSVAQDAPSTSTGATPNLLDGYQSNLVDPAAYNNYAADLFAPWEKEYPYDLHPRFR